MQRTAALGLLLIIGTVLAGALRKHSQAKWNATDARANDSVLCSTYGNDSQCTDQAGSPGWGVISLNALRSMITSAFMASAASWWRRSRRCACVRMGSSALAVSTSTTTRRLTRRTRLYLPVSSQPSSSSSSSSPSSASVRIDQNSVAGRSGNRKREQKQLRSSTWRPQLAPGAAANHVERVDSNAV